SPRRRSSRRRDAHAPREAATASGRLHPEAIADAADGLHATRAGGLRLDLGAQVPDVHVDDALVAGERLPAQPGGDLAARVHPARILGEDHEEVELRRREVAELAVHSHLVTREVDLEASVVESEQ